ncbi:MAG: HDOD domain-containing protein [Gammaproteobacteria bacterium]|nr:HDOD domain-containing protein [Gammaproteobacteria bacterium]
MISLERLVDSSSKLGTLPAIVYRVFDAMDDPNSTATQIGRIINDDPALTARLLKLVNSPFYGFTSKVDTVYRAIALIGHRELRSVVLAASAVKVFDGIPAELVNMPVFWKRSLYTAVVARVLAAFRREKEIERYFIAGLLHDIGSLLLYVQLPDEMTRALSIQQAESIPLWAAEKKELGYDHAQVGGALLKKWSLPPMLCQSVRFHLHPEKSPEVSRDSASLIHLAWQIMNHYIDVDESLELDNLIPESVWQVAGLKSDILPKVLDKAGQQYLASKDVLLAQ